MQKAKRTIAVENKKFAIVRRALKMSQSQFGAELDRSQGMIAKYESGEQLIPQDVVKLLATKFNISMDWWHKDTGPMKAAQDKGSLIKDIGKLTLEKEHLELRVEALERLVKELVRDVKAMKLGV
jgi:transcriptional regulator with XRE-family HTH domain